jgi:hypothetical protein
VSGETTGRHLARIGLQVLCLAGPALPNVARLPAAGRVVVYDPAETGLRQFAGWLVDKEVCMGE